MDHDYTDEMQDAEEVTYQEKIRFTQRMKLLTQEDLAKIVQMIQGSCQDAFKETGEGKAQILVDNIDVESFQKINEYVVGYLGKSMSGRRICRGIRRGGESDCRDICLVIGYNFIMFDWDKWWE